MKKETKTVLLLSGGGGHEDEISLQSADYVASLIKPIDKCQLIELRLYSESCMRDRQGRAYRFCSGGILMERSNSQILIDYVIPYFHGYPGETGDIQSVLDFYGLPYLGPTPEVHRICFNKYLTKLVLRDIGAPVGDYRTFLNREAVLNLAADSFFAQDLFVKASSQGSSIGCYRASGADDVRARATDAFAYSDQVIVETAILGRELEVAVYDYEGQLVVTDPCEIIPPKGGFYSYEEKYSATSRAQTVTRAEGISPEALRTIKTICRELFAKMQLKDLARIDFFMSRNEEIFVNEINTFPGMTPISMFPKMLLANGDDLGLFFASLIDRSALVRAEVNRGQHDAANGDIPV